MKFTTKHNSGVIELLIVAPLFLGMICVIAWIGFLLVAKSKMEKHAWVVQTKKTYNIDIDPTQLNPKYELDGNLSWRQGFQMGSMFQKPLPSSFKAFLASKVTSYKKLKLQAEASNVIQQIYNAGFETPLGERNPEDEPIPNILPYAFEADLIIADTSMNFLEPLKGKMQDEALVEAGFANGYTFRRLGFKEMDDAGVPLAKVMEVLANMDLPKDYLDEVKRWMGI